ncbi:MAG: acyl-CoA/acyl-ACP dehydrogenase [Deltaproteobacteria bacterium]|nr:acyl-CoA/acyl-ACP dehydrogenase [Deltaproteobacteria bacterium]
MKAEEIRAFAETARRFAQKEIAPMLADERDGNLEGVPGLLELAESVGLLASADPESPGRDFGVWGNACLKEGPGFSVAVLREIARTCAGVASCLHFAGLGALELMGTKHVPRRVVVAFFEETWRLTGEAIKTPPHRAARLEQKDSQQELSGKKNFVHALPECDAFVIYASGASGWQPVLIPRKSAGLILRDVGQRSGLAAVEVVNLSFERVLLNREWLLSPRAPSLFLRRLLLGLCAISLGNAEGALDAGRNYAAGRYQGGDQIDSHGAVLLMLGDAASRVWACSAYLDNLCKMDGDTDDALLRAFAAKLRITIDCCQAVSDCLQVFGGYGYMEDFAMEKRLRDALTLKIVAMRPDDMRVLCALHSAGDEA